MLNDDFVKDDQMAAASLDFVVTATLAAVADPSVALRTWLKWLQPLGILVIELQTPAAQQAGFCFDEDIVVVRVGIRDDALDIAFAAVHRSRLVLSDGKRLRREY